MKFTFAASVLLVLGPICGYGQAPIAQPPACSLKLAQSPAVRGIRLGMKLEDVLAMFPGSRDDQHVKSSISSDPSSPRYGVVHFAVDPRRYSTKERFTGIEAFYFWFVDEQLVDYWLPYSPPPWPELDEFIDKVAQAFHLPPARSWAGNPYQKDLGCEGFKLRAANKDGRASLRVWTSDDPQQIQRERRAAAEAQARRDFRP